MPRINKLLEATIDGIELEFFDYDSQSDTSQYYAYTPHADWIPKELIIQIGISQTGTPFIEMCDEDGDNHYEINPISLPADPDEPGALQELANAMNNAKDDIIRYMKRIGIISKSKVKKNADGDKIREVIANYRRYADGDYPYEVAERLVEEGYTGYSPYLESVLMDEYGDRWSIVYNKVKELSKSFFGIDGEERARELKEEGYSKREAREKLELEGLGIDDVEEVMRAWERTSKSAPIISTTTQYNLCAKAQADGKRLGLTKAKITEIIGMNPNNMLKEHSKKIRIIKASDGDIFVFTPKGI